MLYYGWTIERYFERLEMKVSSMNEKESKSRSFINQIEKVNCIYNKTKEIYFDKENIYLEMK